jgi:hypothetical protein
LVKDSEDVTILIEDTKWLDCRMTKKTVSLMKDNEEITGMISIMLLLKKICNFSVRLGMLKPGYESTLLCNH